MNSYNFSWNELAFANKSHVKDLNATFVLAPRHISEKRFIDLVKQFLPTGNIIVGIANEPYIDGFYGQPQFATLQLADVKNSQEKVNTSPSPNKIYTLKYNQKNIVHILNKLKFKKVILINGSWERVFHSRPEYYYLAENNIKTYRLSPFVDETEAIEYADNFASKNKFVLPKKSNSDFEVMDLVNQVAKYSFDNTFQLGVVLAKKQADKYTPIVTAHNKVVPYETYAWHTGPAREVNFSAPNDLNHYDTIHAEQLAIVQSQKQSLDLTNTTMFINVMPCPSCARILCETDISEFVYSLDHSDGYAIDLLSKAGKKIRRLLTNERTTT